MKTETLLLAGAIAWAAFVDAHAQPNITKQATNQSVSLGATVKFQISATSTKPPIAYQWRLSSANLDGKTNSSLTLTNIQVINAGDYDAVLSDGSGSVTSRVAHLEVDPTFTKITTGSIVTNLFTCLSPAWGDYDNDGFIDLVSGAAANYSTGLGQKIVLFHNNRDGTFTKVENAITAEARDWRGCSWADYDNDGNLDLFVASVQAGGFASQNALFRNNGDGTFKKMTSTDVGDIVLRANNSNGPIWADYDRDGFVDLFVGMADEPDRLFRNLGNGTFTQVANTSVGLVLDKGINFGVMWGDYDNDGWPDLYVPVLNDSGIDQTNLFYHNRGDGTFSRILTGAIATDNEYTGSCRWIDYDNDGYLDLFVVNFASIDVSSTSRKPNSLYHNNGDGTFTKMTTNIVGSIVGDIGKFHPSTWGDFDNDGFVDMFLVNWDPGLPNVFYHNNGDGSFTRVLSGSLVHDTGAASTGCAVGDYDNDGFLDLFVTRGGVTGPASNLLYRNSGNSNSWLKVKLVGTVSNRSAIGAKVRVKATIHGKSMWQMREINSGGGFGQSPLEAHFGLGDATMIETVRVEWPSGTIEEFRDVQAKQFLTITEPPRLMANLASGAPQVTIRGGRGFQYEVQVSKDLKAWLLLDTIAVTNLDGTAAIADQNSLISDRSFYRILSR